MCLWGILFIPQRCLYYTLKAFILYIKDIMRNYILYILFVLLSTPVRAQYAIGNKPQGAGDRIESASFNDHKRGTARRLQYRPDGDDFVCVNG